MKAILSNKESENTNFFESSITITGSKSISNRLLILQKYFSNLTIENLSNSNDTALLLKGLKIKNGEVDIHHAGTSMRFLTAYYASQDGVNITITGSKRMQERPIKILVDALKELGAEIQYLENEGFPPLRIHGKKLHGKTLLLKTDVSSQFITALMLIAPTLPQGLVVQFKDKNTSWSYVKMTLLLLQKIGISCNISMKKIIIKPIKKIKKIKIIIESDWSSASYFYSIIALSENKSITLKNFYKNSLQGDSAIATIYKSLGVKTTFNEKETSITISNYKKHLPKNIVLNLVNTPDIAQTIAVTCFGLGIECNLKGLHTLKNKESDRLFALKTELEKLGAKIIITNNSFELKASDSIKENITIDTYEDHRMAMAFAPIGLMTSIKINNPDVVSKSYPNFWKNVAQAGLNVLLK